MSKLLKFVKDELVEFGEFVKEVLVDSDDEKPHDVQANCEETSSLVEKPSLVATSSDATSGILEVRPTDDALRRASRGEPSAGSRADGDCIKVSPSVVPRTKMTLPDSPAVLYTGQRSRSSSSSSSSDSASPRRTISVSEEASKEGRAVSEEKKAFNPPPRKSSTSSLPRKPSLGFVRPKAVPPSEGPKTEHALSERAGIGSNELGFAPPKAEPRILSPKKEDATSAEAGRSSNEIGEPVRSGSSMVGNVRFMTASAPAVGISKMEGAIPDGLSPLGWPTSRLGEVRMPSEMIGGIGLGTIGLSASKGGTEEIWKASITRPINTQLPQSSPGRKTSYMQFRAHSGNLAQRNGAGPSLIAEVEPSPVRKLTYVEARKARLATSATGNAENEPPVWKLSYAEGQRAGAVVYDSGSVPNAESELIDIRRKQSYSERRKVTLDKQSGEVSKDQQEPKLLDITRKQSYSERRKVILDKSSGQVSNDQQDSPVLRKGSYAEVRKKVQRQDIRATRLASHDVNLEATTQARKYKPEIVQVVRKSTYVRKSASSSKENAPDEPDSEDEVPVHKMSLSYGQKRRAKWPTGLDAGPGVIPETHVSPLQLQASPSEIAPVLSETSMAKSESQESPSEIPPVLSETCRAISEMQSGENAAMVEEVSASGHVQSTLADPVLGQDAASGNKLHHEWVEGSLTSGIKGTRKGTAMNAVD